MLHAFIVGNSKSDHITVISPGTYALPGAKINLWQVVARISGCSSLVRCVLIPKRALAAVSDTFDLIVIQQGTRVRRTRRNIHDSPP